MDTGISVNLLSVEQATNAGSGQQAEALWEKNGIFQQMVSRLQDGIRQEAGSAQAIRSKNLNARDEALSGEVNLPEQMAAFSGMISLSSFLSLLGPYSKETGEDSAVPGDEQEDSRMDGFTGMALALESSAEEGGSPWQSVSGPASGPGAAAEPQFMNQAGMESRFAGLAFQQVGLENGFVQGQQTGGMTEAERPLSAEAAANPAGDTTGDTAGFRNTEAEGRSFTERFRQESARPPSGETGTGQPAGLPQGVLPGGDSQVQVSIPDPAVAKAEPYGQIGQEIVSRLGQKGPMEFSMQLEPESLGQIHINLKLSEGKLMIDIMAASARTQALLSGQVDKLVQSMGLQNVQVESVQVSQQADSQNAEGQSAQSQPFYPGGGMNFAQNERQGQWEALKDAIGGAGLTGEDLSDDQETRFAAGPSRRLDYVV